MALEDPTWELAAIASLLVGRCTRLYMYSTRANKIGRYELDKIHDQTWAPGGQDSGVGAKIEQDIGTISATHRDFTGHRDDFLKTEASFSHCVAGVGCE